MLSREEILSKRDLKREKVNIPEWGGDIYVSEFSAEARDQWEQEIIDCGQKKQKMINARARLIVLTVVDENYNRIFKDSDIQSIGQLSAEAIDKAVVVSQRLNGLTEKELKSAEKNS